MERIILPTVDGMIKDGNPFQGVLFAGIMVVQGDPFLIEYNVRFGDPECQPMLLRLQNDLLHLLDSCASGKLDLHPPLEWSSNTALAVVIAAKGYPASYAKGGTITGIDEADNMAGVKIFQAGTTKNAAGDIVSSGGRVLGIAASASDIIEAQKRAYEAVDAIKWADGFCRRDIGWQAVKAAKAKTA
jgi:phosphoribosylamine--glycine ligase